MIIESLREAERPLLILPGFMGSRLRDVEGLTGKTGGGGEMLWLDLGGRWDLDELAFGETDSSGSPLHPEGTRDKSVQSAPRVFERTIIADSLVDNGREDGPYTGFVERVSAVPFPFDWREDIRIEARRLARFILDLEAQGVLNSQRRLSLVGHSQGSMVILDALGREPRLSGLLEHVVLVAPPIHGTTTPLEALIDGKLARTHGIFREATVRQTLSTFPSVWQLLPAPRDLYPAVATSSRFPERQILYPLIIRPEKQDTYSLGLWDGEERPIFLRELLSNARLFHEEKARYLPEVIERYQGRLKVIVGIGIETRQRILVRIPPVPRVLPIHQEESESFTIKSTRYGDGRIAFTASLLTGDLDRFHDYMAFQSPDPNVDLHSEILTYGRVQLAIQNILHDIPVHATTRDDSPIGSFQLLDGSH